MLKYLKIHISVAHLPVFISCPVFQTVFSNIFISVTGLNQIFPDIPEGEKKQTIKNKITFHSEASLIYAHMNFIFGFVKIFSSLFHLHNALHMHPDHLHGKVPPAVLLIYQKQLQLSKTCVSFMGALPINQMYLFESSPFFFNGHRVLFWVPIYSVTIASYLNTIRQ